MPSPSALPSTSRARLWHQLTCLVIFLSLSIQTVIIVLVERSPEGIVFPLGIRLWNLASYFTIWSNAVVFVSVLPLIRPAGRDGPWLRALRLDGLVMITITGLVYVTLLAPLWDPQGWQAVADYGLHYAAPLLAVFGWLFFGPRGRVDASSIGRALVLPLIWVGYTFWRAGFVHYEKEGQLRDFYPYPFLDVGALGYAAVLGFLAVILVAFLSLLGLFAWLDGKLPAARRHTA